MNVCTRRTVMMALWVTGVGVARVATDTDLQAKLERMEKALAEVTAANQEFQRRQEILTTEIRKVREQMVLPEEPKYKSQYGMGPAASKVYGVQRGLSIGGYGQGWYTNLVDDQGPNDHSRFDLQRVILYTGYKFSDRLVFNSELEVEHASTGLGGEVSMEFAQIDYLANPHYNFRMGLLLIPMGFINEVHEPVFYHGNERPETERQIIPTTWRENGVGAFGQINDRWTYRAYVVNSGRSSTLRAANLRGFRQNGAQTFADDFAFVARSDYQVSNQLTLGGSIFSGDGGQREDFRLRNNTVLRPDAALTLREAHVQYRNRGLEIRALSANGHIGNAAVLSDSEARQGRTPISEDVYGYYGELAFDLATLFDHRRNIYLAPFFRYERFDTQYRVPRGFAADKIRDVELRTTGIDYKPHPQVVFKLDHRNFSLGRATRADELNLGFGYIF